MHDKRMPQSKTSTQSLKLELAKQARLSSFQGALPLPLRALPSVAILTGGYLAANGRNAVEGWLLGGDETTLLQEPSRSACAPVDAKSNEGRLDGMITMCGTCRGWNGYLWLHERSKSFYGRLYPNRYPLCSTDGEMQTHGSHW